MKTINSTYITKMDLNQIRIFNLKVFFQIQFQIYIKKKMKDVENFKERKMGELSLIFIEKKREKEHKPNGRERVRYE